MVPFIQKAREYALMGLLPAGSYDTKKILQQEHEYRFIRETD